MKNENKRLIPEQKLIFNKNQRSITYSKDLADDRIRRLIPKRDDKEDNASEIGETILGDEILCCDFPLQSRNQVFIYNKDGTYEAYNFCGKCVHELLKYNLGPLFDEAKNMIKMKDVLGNQAPVVNLDIWPCEEDKETHELWPIITFGQLIWNLVNEPITANTARAYVTALAARVLHNPLYVTFCPCHPEVVYKLPAKGTKISCNDKSCNLFLCPDCNRWHTPGNCSVEKIIVPPGWRICPACKNLVEKSKACNHMHCLCGCDFCYYCEAGPFSSDSECYTHLGNEHGGCGNNPPDYKKFCLGMEVPESEFEEFYRKYPKFKDRVIKQPSNK